MQLTEHADLSALNSMRLPSIARYFATPTTLTELQQLLQSELAQQYPIFILGGGSNVLLAASLSMLVIQPALRGTSIQPTDTDTIWVSAMAGENWHEFVQYCVAQGCYGLENLSLIPGSVGAAPIQNIGAYGVEIKELVAELSALNIRSGLSVTFTNESCGFGYPSQKW